MNIRYVLIPLFLKSLILFTYCFSVSEEMKEKKRGDAMIILNLPEQSQCRHVFNRMSGLPRALDCIVSFQLIWGGNQKAPYVWARG